MIHRHAIPPALLASLLSVLALIALAVPPARAQAVFPAGLRVGLQPPPGMSPSRNFPGFEDPDRKAAITIADLPGTLYSEIEKAVFTKELKQPGVSVDQRETFPFNTGVGYLVSFRAKTGGNINHRWILLATSPVDDLATLITVEIPAAARGSYSNKTIRAALASVTFRATPIDEQVALLPFKVSDMAGFRPVRVFQRAGLLLTSGPRDDDDRQPQIFISVAAGGPQQTSERGNFAQQLLAAAPLRDMNIVASEAMRLSSQPGHEIRAEGKTGSGAALSIVQWVRFGGGGYMRIVAIARKEDWNEAFPRFRAVRDSIDSR